MTQIIALEEVVKGQADEIKQLKEAVITLTQVTKRYLIKEIRELCLRIDENAISAIKLNDLDNMSIVELEAKLSEVEQAISDYRVELSEKLELE